MKFKSKLAGALAALLQMGHKPHAWLSHADQARNENPTPALPPETRGAARA